MPYTRARSNWVDGESQVLATHMNQIENGIVNATATAESAQNRANTCVPYATANATYATIANLNTTKATAEAALPRSEAASTYATISALNDLKSSMFEARVLSPQTIAGGSYFNWSINFAKSYSSIPAVFVTVNGQEFKGSAVAHTITTTGCRIRVDNLGTSPGSVGCAVMVIGV